MAPRSNNTSPGSTIVVESIPPSTQPPQGKPEKKDVPRQHRNELLSSNLPSEVISPPMDLSSYLQAPTTPYKSPYTPATSAASKQTLAEISERVRNILAPVHALSSKGNSIATPSTTLSSSVTPSASAASETALNSNGTAASSGLGSSSLNSRPTPFEPLRIKLSVPSTIRNRSQARAKNVASQNRRKTAEPAAEILGISDTALNTLETPNCQASSKPEQSSKTPVKAPAIIRNGKRKRQESQSSNEPTESESSENFAPLPPQSRSGRKIFQTANISNSSPVVVSESNARAFSDSVESPSSKSLHTPIAATAAAAAVAAATTVAPARNTTRKRGKGRASRTNANGANGTGTPNGTGAGAVCKKCERGHSPASNAIVFCDGCNTPWHQFCHYPPIKSDAVRIAEREWFCAECSVTREERTRIHGRTAVAATNMSLFDKRQYFQGLSQPDLVALLVHACILHPDLPVFNSRPPAANENEGDHEVPPYPKAGFGVPLPPERESLSFLLEDEDCRTFSHRWEGIGDMITSALSNGLMARVV